MRFQATEGAEANVFIPRPTEIRTGKKKQPSVTGKRKRREIQKHTQRNQGKIMRDVTDMYRSWDSIL